MLINIRVLWRVIRVPARPLAVDDHYAKRGWTPFWRLRLMRLFTEMKPDGEMALVRYVIRTLSELSHLRRSLTNTAKIEIEISVCWIPHREELSIIKACINPPLLHMQETFFSPHMKLSFWYLSLIFLNNADRRIRSAADCPAFRWVRNHQGCFERISASCQVNKLLLNIIHFSFFTR